MMVFSTKPALCSICAATALLLIHIIVVVDAAAAAAKSKATKILTTQEYNKLPYVRKSNLSFNYGKCSENFKLGVRCNIYLPKIDEHLIVDVYVGGEADARKLIVDASTASNKQQVATLRARLYEKLLSELNQQTVFRFSLLDVLAAVNSARPNLLAEIQIATQHFLPASETDKLYGYNMWLNTTIAFGSKVKTTTDARRFQLDNNQLRVPPIMALTMPEETSASSGGGYLPESIAEYLPDSVSGFAMSAAYVGGGLALFGAAAPYAASAGSALLNLG